MREITMPPILYGTAWKKERTRALVEEALRLGFRGVDTACQPKHYDEPGVGAGLSAAARHGIERSAVYMQTKFTPLRGQDPRRIPYDRDAPLEDQVRQSCQASLRNLQTPTVDGLLLHSPLGTFDETLRAWRALEDCVDGGFTRRIGISNCYDLRTFEALWDAARIKPAILQNRFYAETGYDALLRAFCRERSVAYQGFWTLTANPHVLREPRVAQLAARHGVTSEQLFLRFLTQIGVVPLVGTTSARHMRDDLALFDFTLTEDEVLSVTDLLSSRP
jgi:diketogulonate reductase-like aldo/keto reductase